MSRARARITLGSLLAVGALAAAATPGGAATSAGTAPPLCLPAVLADLTGSTPPSPAPAFSYGVTDNHPSASTAPLLADLAGGTAGFGVHDYVSATESPSATTGVIDALAADARRGLRVTLTIDDEGAPLSPPATAAFVAVVRDVVARVASFATAVEITNEPNLPIPGASDGFNPQIVADVVQGVVAAKETARAAGSALQVGFNDVYTYDSPFDAVFWTQLQAAADATPAFRGDVDWMGLHTYPNLLSADVPTAVLDGPIEQAAMASGRCHLTALEPGRTVPIRITEAGYPTMLGAAEYQQQAVYWKDVLTTVRAYSGTYGVDRIFVFLLQDSMSSTPGPLSGFGLYDASGAAKPAAAVVRAAVRTG